MEEGDGLKRCDDLLDCGANPPQESNHGFAVGWRSLLEGDLYGESRIHVNLGQAAPENPACDRNVVSAPDLCATYERPGGRLETTQLPR